MDYSKNEKYFQLTSLKAPIILIGLGVLFLGVNAFLGIVLAAIGGGILYMPYAGRPSDSEIDEICAKEAAKARERALKEIGLDEDEVKIIDPIFIQGPCYNNISTQYLCKQGKDGRWRSSNYESIVLFFNEKQVYSYAYRFSIINDEKNENTDEYFYKDIVSVSTSNNSTPYSSAKGKNFTVNYQQFMLTTSGGTSISCSVRDYDSAEKSIKGMKQLLREKKNVV